MESFIVYYGSKRLVAPVIWAGLGTPSSYIEPFCGSCATFFEMPRRGSADRQCATILNDINGYIVNILRCIRNNPDRLSDELGYPVTDTDITSYLRNLNEIGDALRNKMENDHTYCDYEVASQYLYCAGTSIGGTFISDKHKQTMRTHPTGMLKYIWYENGQDDRIRVLKDISKRLQTAMIYSRPFQQMDCYYNILASKQGNHTTFVDPPYEIDKESQRSKNLYLVDTDLKSLYDKTLDIWKRTGVRMCVAGSCASRTRYLDEKWYEFVWNRQKPFGKNTDKEYLWFSPNCNIDAIASWQQNTKGKQKQGTQLSFI